MNLNRNLIIEASAGTGKTYNLVLAILRALFQKRLPFSTIVALTFTKKAAGEMKERVASRLGEILQADQLPELYADWGLTLDDLQSLARKALEEIDRALISTIHSFAFTLLQRYPLAAGINPGSEIDEKGLRYEQIFETEWPLWLSRELRDQAPHEEDWLAILRVLSLDEVEAMARRLADFDIPIERLPVHDTDLAERLKPFHDALRPLQAVRGKKEVNNNKIAAACEELLASVIASRQTPLLSPEGRGAITTSSETKENLRLKISQPSGWSDEDVALLKKSQAIAQNLLKEGDALMAILTRRLKPFVIHFRQTALAHGALSHNALLSLACRLVRSRHDIRVALKKDLRMIFIDEFQDTDPLQGELLLFLAERIDGRAEKWSDVKLEEGKLFVVGDPKQSIYRFRGADIAAYRQISDLILAQGGQAIPLQKSWRSHDAIIHSVNAAFSHIIQEKGVISPPYVPLLPQRQRNPDLPLQEVELRLVPCKESDLDAKEIREWEAESAAQWMADNVGKLKDEKGNPLQYRDIALVFRSSNAMRPFVEALRRRDIPYVVEGERYFYSTPEVTDLINFLRVIQNPGDRLALVGFLRSPIGGFTDLELFHLQQGGVLNASKDLPATAPVHQRKTWELIRILHRRVQREPLKEVMRHVFEDSFIQELAARSYHREQTLANILKLKRLLEEFAEDSATTLPVMLTRVRDYMEEDQAEGESPLADESFDAVRLLTIHKSKGLEFPVVILPNLQAPRTKRSEKQNASVILDWTTDRLGVQVAGLANLTRFELEAEVEAREEEEEKRVLYVALTRAKERLILTGGDNYEKNKNSYLNWLQQAWSITPPKINTSSIPTEFGPGTANDNKRSTVPGPDVDFQAFAKEWRERAKTEERLTATAQRVTPTGRHAQRVTPDDSSRDALPIAPSDVHALRRSDESLRRGTLLHLFLEHWDFACKKCDMPAMLRGLADRYFANEGIAEPEGLVDSVQKILAGFIGSEDYQEIADAEILGREVPFFYGDPLMRGSIDILYRTVDGQVVIGDYKTQHHSQDYAEQSMTYREAIRRSLGLEAQFKLIFLTRDKSHAAAR